MPQPMPSHWRYVSWVFVGLLLAALALLATVDAVRGHGLLVSLAARGYLALTLALPLLAGTAVAVTLRRGSTVPPRAKFAGVACGLAVAVALLALGPALPLIGDRVRDLLN